MNFYVMCYMLFALRKDNNIRFKPTRAGPGIDMGKSNREGLSPMNIVFAYQKKKMKPIRIIAGV